MGQSAGIYQQVGKGDDSEGKPWRSPTGLGEAQRRDVAHKGLAACPKGEGGQRLGEEPKQPETNNGTFTPAESLKGTNRMPRGRDP